MISFLSAQNRRSLRYFVLFSDFLFIFIYTQAEDLEPAMDPQNALKVDVGKSKVREHLFAY